MTTLGSPLLCAPVLLQLPPELRAQQASMFNSADTGYDILVATDAIGMGLNLNIRRIVFHTMTKFDGESEGLLPTWQVRRSSTEQRARSPHPNPTHRAPRWHTHTHTQVKQIAGRAGRYGSRWPNGTATTLLKSDLPYLVESLDTPIQPLSVRGCLR